MHWMLMPLRRVTDFSGRSRRREFWSWFLFYALFSFVLMFVDAALGIGGSYSGYAEGASAGFAVSGGLLTGLFLIAGLLPTIAVSVRRMHDIGKAGWQVLLGLIPLFGWIYVLYCYVQPGVAGPNLYGPDPKSGMAA